MYTEEKAKYIEYQIELQTQLSILAREHAEIIDIDFSNCEIVSKTDATFQCHNVEQLRALAKALNKEVTKEDPREFFITTHGVKVFYIYTSDAVKEQKGALKVC